MAFDADAKAKVIKQFQRDAKDSGSAEVQVALITTRINHLTEHLKFHKNDFHSRYGLVKLVSKRRRLLNYLKGKYLQRYYGLIDTLGIRR